MSVVSQWWSKSVFGSPPDDRRSYHSAESEEGDDASLLKEGAQNDGESEDGFGLQSSKSSRLQRSWIKWTVGVILLALYTFLIIALVPRSCSDKECTEKLSLWSPLNEAVEYLEYDFDTAFDQKSKYRGPPTTEIETAWSDLLRLNPVPFPEDKLHFVNRTGGVLGDHKLARVDENPDSPIAATFEVFHQLHCLNYLRQYTWRDWYFRHPDQVVIPSDMLSSDVGVRMHADHCIDLIREALICHGDTAPFFTVVDPEQPMGARGDFNAHHKCRNFESLQKWVDDNQVDLNTVLESNHD